MQKQPEDLADEIAGVTGMDTGQVKGMLERVDATGETAAPSLREKGPEEITPPGWPTLTTGELIDIKGIWFEVAGMESGLLYLKTRGPTRALIKRLAKKAEHGKRR